ncbi:outer membrane lipoprotein carrier protein LolA [Flavobacterium sp. JP2137]|uniref:outer membrane lipoprotein carrier protein LolA n=1 Tax=Flavobacterium sp. JP2137 TaxID=3414510 RepID=UPI003D2FACE6
MKIRVLLVLLLIFSQSIRAQQRSMNAAEIKVFKETTVAEAKKIKTLTTDFVQYKHMSFLDKEIVSEGKMSLKTPGKLLWQYDKPFVYSIVFKDNKVYVNDQGKKNKIDLGNNKKFEKINALIMGSVSGNMFDESAFVITYFKDKNQDIAKLKPKLKEVNKYIKEIVLYFSSDQSTVSEVKLIEPSDDYTRIIFKNKKTNTALDDTIFNN